MKAPKITADTPIGADVDLEVEDVRTTTGRRLTASVVEEFVETAEDARDGSLLASRANDEDAKRFAAANNGEGPDIVEETDNDSLDAIIAARRSAAAG